MTETETHFLQSIIWEQFQRALGKSTLWVDGHLGIIEKNKLFKKIYFPYVNISDIEMPDFTTKVFEAANSLALPLVAADFISTSPDKLRENNWREVKPIQAKDTAVNNVAISENDILARIQRRKRKDYQKSIKDGVEFVVSYDESDVDAFLRLIREIETRKQITIHSPNYFKTLARTMFKTRQSGLIMAKWQGQPIAARMFLRDKKRLFGLNASASRDEKCQIKNIGPALQVYTLLWAHREGLKSVDWWGIAPEGAPASHPWTGFTQYKLSFGGERVHYAGTWELPVKRGRYLAYKLIKKALRKP
jgi:lipid II:glycine glycyltransferase (peptidoglycan interpeptide bridge formation enzyme)